MKITISTLLLFTNLSFATDEIEKYVLVTNKSVTVESLKTSEVRAIFLGDQSFWSGSSLRVRAVRLSDFSSGVTELLGKDLGMSSDQFLMHWRRRLFAGRGIPPKVAANEQEFGDYIAENPNSVGFLRVNALKQFSHLKELTVIE